MLVSLAAVVAAGPTMKMYEKANDKTYKRGKAERRGWEGEKREREREGEGWYLKCSCRFSGINTSLNLIYLHIIY